MIRFRPKKVAQDLIPDAIEFLKSQKTKVNLIKSSQADQVSKVNSKAMVLESFCRNDKGFYEITIRDKELYNYTQKLIGDIFKMRITNIDKKTRQITAEVDYLGIALDIIDVLAAKYNLSIVEDGNSI